MTRPPAAMRLLPSREGPGADLYRMKSICLPHTELPGTSALFADYLYHYPRAARFYGHDPHDPSALKHAATEFHLPDERREALVAALRKFNGESVSLDQLELPDTVAIVTGQQVGLFGGPVYSIYKALTAAKLARQLSDDGVRAVPVFWLATEDHDFAEVDHCHVYDSRRRPVRLQMKARGAAGQPVGGMEIISAPLDELRGALHGLLYADEVMALVEDCYRPGRTLGEAFRLLLGRLLAGSGIVFLDPMQPEIRALAAPLLHAAFERAEDLSERLHARNAELKHAGYHAQVLFESHTSLFFKLENGRRLPLRRNGSDYFHETRKFTAAELAANPEALSPSALLRPVMQDYLLPTAAYVGGPAELAYLAQSQVLYEALLGRMPVATPRSGFTLLDERARGLMDRHMVTLPGCFHGLQPLKERIAAGLVPSSLQVTFDQTQSEIRAVLDRLERELEAFDPTLGAAMSKSKAKVLYQIDKNRRKAAREALRRDTVVTDGAEYLSHLVFPQRVLQERFYSILPFLAQHGFNVLDTIEENIHSGCPDHLLLTV
jgi:bacillithiol synthase